MNAEGELFTFTTSSRGGLAPLLSSRRYGRHRYKHPDVHPVIALDVDSYKRANKSYGIIKTPQFTPMGWEPKSKFNEALAAIGAGGGDVAPPEPEVKDELNDEIPF